MSRGRGSENRKNGPTPRRKAVDKIPTESVNESLSHSRKLARAETHIDQIESTINSWRSDGYRVFTKPDGKGGTVMVAELLKPLPDILPLVIGDALQNLRNSLDNLAFALAVAHTPNMTPRQEKDVSFPISDQAIVSIDRRIKMISPNAKSDICSLAPDPGRQPLDQDPLWLLNKTNNRDKHRGISVFAVAAGIHGVAIQSGYIDHLRLIGPQQLELGVISEPLMEWGPKAHMNAQLSHSLKVTFDKGVEVENWEVIPTLRWIHKHIRDTVFQRLEQYL